VQCLPSRARLRRLVRTIRPPLPRHRYEATQAPVCRQLPRSPFRSSHLSPSLIIFHPASRRRYPNLDPRAEQCADHGRPSPRLARRFFAHAFARSSQFIASVLASVTVTARVLATYTSVSNLKFATRAAASVS
jgi:hypothetical protein